MWPRKESSLRLGRNVSDFAEAASRDRKRMANNTPDDHSEEFEELAALSALDALEGEELTCFEDHRARCVRCRRTEQLDREALMRLPWAPPEMEPSPGFKTRLLQRGAQELGRSAAPYRLPAGEGVALAALLILLLAGGTAFYEYQPVAAYELEGSGPGSATVILHRSGGVEVDLRDLPEPGSGFEYAVWAIQAGGGPRLAGMTTSGTGVVRLDGAIRGTTVAITLERSRTAVPTAPFLKVVHVTPE